MLLANPLLAARALMALTDPTADEELRFDGALLVSNFIADVHMLRLGIIKSE